jgi:hypothetical protein
VAALANDLVVGEWPMSDIPVGRASLGVGPARSPNRPFDISVARFRTVSTQMFVVTTAAGDRTACIARPPAPRIQRPDAAQSPVQTAADAAKFTLGAVRALAITA